jgi:hypothetical protein
LPTRRRTNAPGVATAERLWRVRKQRQTIDAVLRHHGDDSTGIELQFLLEGDLATGRLYPTRELAVAAADEKRRELERAGWIHHW